MRYRNSELILHPDGSLYHLRIKPEHIFDHVITVGDPDRVDRIASRFDRIIHTVRNREFYIAAGTYRSLDITIIATGIGTDNIDIVLNELDAAVNIDLQQRTDHETRRSLNIIRLGTSGAIQSDIDVDSLLVSAWAIGLDGLMHYYPSIANENATAIEKACVEQLQEISPNLRPYAVPASAELLDQLGHDIPRGITCTAPGFYGPQGRSLRLPPRQMRFVERLSAIEHGTLRTTNLEMETAGIYGLGRLLGHRCLSFNVILANRQTGTFSQRPREAVDRLIDLVLQRLVDR